MEKLACFDFGGTKFARGLRLENGELIRGDDFFPQTIDDLTKMVHDIIRECGGVQGLAVATAGVIGEYKIVETSPNIQWLSGVDLSEWALKEFGVFCVVGNDLLTAIIAEKKRGVLIGCKNGMMDTFSTGWGGALIVNDADIPGEPGHGKAVKTLSWGSRPCNCGKLDCNEAHFSGGAVERFLRFIFAGREYLFPGFDLNPCACLDAEAEKRTPFATKLYTDVGEGIGEAWAALINRFSICEKIVFMGKFGMLGMKFMLPTIRKVMLDRVMFENHKRALRSEIETGEPALIFPSSVWPLGGLHGAAIVFDEQMRLRRAAV